MRKLQPVIPLLIRKPKTAYKFLKINHSASIFPMFNQAKPNKTKSFGMLQSP